MKQIENILFAAGGLLESYSKAKDLLKKIIAVSKNDEGQIKCRKTNIAYIFITGENQQRNISKPLYTS